MTSLLLAPRKIARLLTREERRQVVVLFVLMVVAMGLEALSAALVVPALSLTSGSPTDRWPLLQRAVDALGHPSDQFVVIAGMLVLAACYLIKNAFLALLAWRQTRFAHGVDADLSQRLFTLYLSQPYTFHLQRNSAQLITNVTREVNLVCIGAIVPALTLCTETLVLIGLAALLLKVEPAGATVVGVSVVLAFWTFHRLTNKYTDRWGEARQAHEVQSLQHLQQGVGAVKEVILAGRESEFLSQYEWHNSRRAIAQQRSDALQQMPKLALEMVAIVCLAGLVVLLVARGRPATAVLPTLGLFAAVAFRVMPSVNRILGSLQVFRFSLPAVDQVHDDFARLESGRNTRDATKGAPFTRAIEVRNVSYTYAEATDPAIRGFTLRIGHGESVGIIGASGAGKSTLIDVILGLLVPTEGAVLVDGRDIRADVRRWQDQIGYVPQILYLTDDTVRRNVAFGLSDEAIDDAAVWKALRAAQLDDFVSSLPNGLDTPLGEGGVRISGGQRQRIGIARALYHDPAVLVLDEATSALDTVTERGVMNVVQDLKTTRTIIIVTHRLTTIEQCDRVFRIENGQIAETPAAESATAG